MHVTRGRLVLGVLTLVFVSSAIAILVWSNNSSAVLTLSPSEAVSSDKRGTTVRVTARVVESTRTDGVMRLKLADPDAPSSAVLDAAYRGAQRLTFGPGVVVIATGVIGDDGVLEVSEFVSKAPAGSEGV